LEAGQIKTVIERALVSYTGQATSDGNAGGTTIVCSGLPATRDFDGQKVIIADGVCAGQARDIDGATTGGTITVTPALSAKVVAGVNFYITTDLPMTEEAAAISAELAKVPKSDAAVTWNATALASVNAEVDSALDTAVPGSPTAGSINERIKTIDDADLPGQLSGGAGVPTFPAAANIGDGVSLAEAIRAILTSLVGGDDYDGYTNINNSANVSINAIFQKLAVLFAADGANVFNPTIQGAARTDLEVALNILATYISDSAAAYSATVDPGGTTRTCIETTLEDLGAMLAGAGITTFPASSAPGDGVSLAEVLRQIYDDITAMQDLTRDGGTVTATGLGTEDNVYINDTPAANYTGLVVLIDLTSMGAGDQATVKEYYRIKSGGGYILKDTLVYNDAQAVDLISIALEPNRYGAKVTIDATVSRTFDWEVFTIE